MSLNAGANQRRPCRSSLLVSLAGAILLLLLCSEVSGQTSCPGRYCGRIDNETSTCRSCPRGSRARAESVCEPCAEDLNVYQWLYLLFMVVIVLAFSAFRIDQYSGEAENVIMLHGSNVLEVVLAAVLALVSFRPQGNVTLQTCGVQQLSDWYPIFFNPSPNFSGTLHCTSEVVYPLYSLVFAFLAYDVVLLLSARPLLVVRFHHRDNVNSLYDALQFMPILALLHATCSGLVYYSYPYLAIVVSLIASAYYFAEMATKGIAEHRKSAVVIGAFFAAMHMLGIGSLLADFDAMNLWPLIFLAFLPSIIFAVSLKVSDPGSLKFKVT